MKHTLFKKLPPLLLAALLCLAAAGCSGETVQEPQSSALPEESSLSQPQPETSSSQEEESSSGEEPSSESEASSEAPSAPPPEAGPAPSSQAEPPAPLPESSAQEEPSSSLPEESSAEPESSSDEGRVAAAASPPEFLGIYAPNVADGGEYLSEIEGDILWIINDERTDLGLNELDWDENLAQAARIRAAELYKYGYTAHKRPDGSDWTTVLKSDVPVKYKSAGEILASIETMANYDKIESGDYWFNQWKNSSTHYDCMVNPRYTHAGVGVVFVYDEENELYYGYACTLFANW